MQFLLTDFDGTENVTASIALHGNELTVRFVVDIDQPIIWPAYTGILRGDELWQTTCLELFIGNPGATHYVEFNVSPEGAWNCYEFSDYRQGMQQSSRLELSAVDNQIDSQQLIVILDSDAGLFCPSPLSVSPLLLSLKKVVLNTLPSPTAPHQIFMIAVIMCL
jgi:hypothetical protein